MTIDFHSEDNHTSYSSREADLTWMNMIKGICDVNGKNVLDIGCGGGIYSKAFASLGATHVTGIDFSEQQLSSAKVNCKGYSNINFYLGNALDTGLEKEQFDIVLERAVIHHIKDLKACFNEAFRVLKPGGVYLIQDRTPEDCLLEGSSTHIRGYFFSKFPQLIHKETSRRYSSTQVFNGLQETGFTNIKEQKLWEIRKTYKELDDLILDVSNRTGRSILHDLTDQQLEDLVVYLKEQLALNKVDSITEKDRWTIWHAKKS